MRRIEVQIFLFLFVSFFPLFIFHFPPHSFSTLLSYFSPYWFVSFFISLFLFPSLMHYFFFSLFNYFLNPHISVSFRTSFPLNLFASLLIYLSLFRSFLLYFSLAIPSLFLILFPSFCFYLLFGYHTRHWIWCSRVQTRSESMDFSRRKNREYDFLRNGNKAVGPMSYIYGT